MSGRFTRMECGQIEDRIRDFTDRELFQGQGGDLTLSTPPFELGVIDSFAFFRLARFIEDEIHVTLPLESIARSVHSRMTGSAS